MHARVFVTLKSGVLDPQGQAIQHALAGLGFAAVDNVRQGKMIEFDIEAASKEAAEAQVAEMCGKLLVNEVIETYRVEIEG